MKRGHILSTAFRCNIRTILLVALLLVTLALLFAGCKSETPTSQPPPSEPTQPAPATEPSVVPPQQPVTPSTEPPPTVPATETPVVVQPSEGELTFTATPEIEELKDVNWISPGKVSIGNLYPGATAEYPITVHNGYDDKVEFAITARQPDQVLEGYEALPLEYLSWVTISQPKLILGSKQTADVLIIVTMPEDALYAGKKAEFWISVVDKSQEGMVLTELAARWLISTK